MFSPANDPGTSHPLPFHPGVHPTPVPIEGTDKFDDLKENPYSEVLGDGEVITWSKGKSHMIAYNRTTIIHFTIGNMSGPNRRKREHALKINFDHLR